MSEAFAVSGRDHFQLDDHQGGAPASPDLAQPGLEEPVGCGEPGFPHRALQDAELVAEDAHLNLQSRMASE
jgi:hypothetical protein